MVVVHQESSGGSTLPGHSHGKVITCHLLKSLLDNQCVPFSMCWHPHNALDSTVELWLNSL